MTKHFCPYCMTPVEEGTPCPDCGLTAGAYNPSPHHLPPGTILMGRYMVGRVLGEGGFGITYIGCDLRLELKVAIKEYFPTDKVTRHAMASLSVTGYMGNASSSFEEGKVRFLNEARTMARMDKQPEIVSVRDFFEDNNTAYIVMEYVEGTTFKELVSQRGGRIPVDELLPMMEPLFSALSAMHRVGLIHRDISPDNLMIEKGALRLLDFGCARESSRGTETMTIALKHGYAPIEQYQHKGQGPWTDVYALSATIYFCLTGKAPPQSLDRLCEDELLLPRKLGINLTERQEKALLYGMGVRPRRRFQSIEELHAALYVPDGSPVPVLEDAESPIQPTAYDVTVPIVEPETPVANEDMTIEQTICPKEREESETHSEDPKAGISRILTFLRKPSNAVIAAAVTIVVCVLLLILLIPRENKTGSDSLAVDSPGVSVSANPNQGDEGIDTPVATGVTKEAYSAEELRELLEDDGVSDIILNTHLLVTGEELVITKPLRITEGHGLNFCAPITVGAGGQIINEGEMCGDGMLRCMDGGSIHIASTGRIEGSGGFLWVENTDDLVVDSGGWINLYGQSWATANPERYLTADEDRIFAAAAHVNTWDELLAAFDDWAVSAIVIDSDIALLERLTSQKPVLINEGVVVTTDSDTNHNFDNSITWHVDNTLLINHGTFTGSLNIGQWSGGSGTAVINYGTVDASLHMDCNGCFLNYGEFISADTHVPSGTIVNLGTICHTGDSGNRFMDIIDGFLNHGQVIIRGEQCHITLASAGTVFNSGSIRVEDQGALNVEEHLVNYGSIYICESATLDGSGYIEQTTEEASLQVEPNGNLPFCGLLTYNIHSTVSLECEHGVTMIPFDWVSNTSGHIGVVNERGLLNELANEKCSVVVIESDLVVTGDLVFTKGVAVSGSLTVKDGSITIKDGGYMISGDTRVENGTVTLKDGGIWLNRSQLTCDELSILDGGQLYNNGQICGVGRINISGGRLMNVTGNIDLTEGQISVNYGQVTSLSSMNLHGCEITISEGGNVASWRGDCYFDSGCTIENRGELSFDQWDWQETILDINMNNYGVLSLCDGVDVYGAITNYGSIHVHGQVPLYGTVNNQGEIIQHDDSNFYCVGGSITGKPAINQ